MKNEKYILALVLSFCLYSHLQFKVNADSNHNSLSIIDESLARRLKNYEETTLLEPYEIKNYFGRSAREISKASYQDGEISETTTALAVREFSIQSLVGKIFEAGKDVITDGIKLLGQGIKFRLDKLKKSCFWYEIGLVDNCLWFYAYKSIQLPFKFLVKRLWSVAKVSIVGTLLPVFGPILGPLLPFLILLDNFIPIAKFIFRWAVRLFKWGRTFVQIPIKVVKFLDKAYNTLTGKPKID